MSAEPNDPSPATQPVEPVPSATGAPASFRPTRWTLILQARGDTPEARAALSDLCAAYYEPIFRFMQREGRGPDEARELTQEFFARILERNGFAAADRTRGRFRSYLLGAVKHFLADQRRWNQRGKRGVQFVHEPLDHAETEEGDEPGGLQVADPAAVSDAWFDREWALALLDRTFAAAAAEASASGKTAVFELLSGWLAGDNGAMTQAEAARQLGWTEGAVKVAIHRLRKRFRELLRAEIAQTVEDGADIQSELRYLVEVLGQS